MRLLENPLAVAIALTVGILLLALLATAWFVLTQFSHGGRGADDDDANPGPGGGGSGRPPNGPSGPTSEPEWWGEFERQFAAHVRNQSESADAHPVHARHCTLVPGVRLGPVAATRLARVQSSGRSPGSAS